MNNVNIISATSAGYITLNTGKETFNIVLTPKLDIIALNILTTTTTYSYFILLIDNVLYEYV